MHNTLPHAWPSHLPVPPVRRVWENADIATLQSVMTALAQQAKPGQVICLWGDLGAGKSTAARFFLRALGASGHIPSPTYTLIQTYDQITPPVVHADLYRLRDAAELPELGLLDYQTDHALLIEWPDRLAGMWVDTAWHIVFALAPDPNLRYIALHSHHPLPENALWP